MNHTRHSAIFDVSNMSVTLVGAGGIGAITALGLAKMGGHDLVIYDDDVVSEENLPTQLHQLRDLGRSKVYGLEETLQAFSDDTILYPEDQRVTAGMSLYGQVVISAVDSIQARKDIWQAVVNGHCGWYIDARMSAEEYHQYAVKMSDPVSAARYGRMIDAEDDSRIPTLPCTSKATFHTALIAAGHIGAALRLIATGHKPPYYKVHNIFMDRLMILEK